MIAVYAMGGGLGHLARARRVVAALGYDPQQAAFFTASKLAPASDPRIVPVPRRLAGSATAFGAWLKDSLRALAPSAVLVDAFPLGILGEFADHGVLPDVPVIHIARLLKWDAYRNAFAGAPRRFEASYTVEPLTPGHEEFLDLNSKALHFLPLNLEEKNRSSNPLTHLPQPIWLIVHSGSAGEVRVLLEFSKRKALEEKADPYFVVVSPRAMDLRAGVERIEHARAWELFPHAARIVTACGFNSMLEAAPWREKHLFLPLERRFDDQFLRAQRAAQC